MKEHRYFVYMMQSASRRALYIGLTSNLHRRVFEHKNDVLPGFTREYQSHRLVYWECYDRVEKAIAREKQLKRWRREKKEWLVSKLNPGWVDLAEHWYEARRSGTEEEHKVPRLPSALRAEVRSG